MLKIVNLYNKKIHQLWINTVYSRTKPKFIVFWYSTTTSLSQKLSRLLKLPITTPKYKNLFCQTSKNVGSFTASA